MGNMTDQDIISDNYREAYKEYLSNQTPLELIDILENLGYSIITIITDEDPTGEKDAGFEDIRANL